MNTNEFLEASYDICIEKHPMISEEDSAILRPMIICEDGYQVSLQASTFHYCEPRKTFKGPYEYVELGFPNQHDALLDEYAEESDTLDTVFGYVPVEVVDQLIEKHGGIIGVRISWDGKVPLERMINHHFRNLKNSLLR